MEHIDKIKQLMTQCKSIDELIDSIGKNDISAVYMRLADEQLKNENNIDLNEKWHRFFVETDSTAVNKWENITNYTIVLISDDLRQMKIIKEK